MGCSRLPGSHASRPLSPRFGCSFCALQDYAAMLRDAGFDGVAAFDRTEQVGGRRV